MHLDHGTDDVPAEVARLVALGARETGEVRGTARAPRPPGLEFCVTGNSPDQGRRRDIG